MQTSLVGRVRGEAAGVADRGADRRPGVSQKSFSAPQKQPSAKIAVCVAVGPRAASGDAPLTKWRSGSRRSGSRAAGRGAESAGEGMDGERKRNCMSESYGGDSTRIAMTRCAVTPRRCVPQSAVADPSSSIGTTGSANPTSVPPPSRGRASRSGRPSPRSAGGTRTARSRRPTATGSPRRPVEEVEASAGVVLVDADPAIEDPRRPPRRAAARPRSRSRGRGSLYFAAFVRRFRTHLLDIGRLAVDQRQARRRDASTNRRSGWRCASASTIRRTSRPRLIGSASIVDPAALGPRQDEQVLDEPVEPVGLRLDVGDRLGRATSASSVSPRWRRIRARP